MKVFWVLAWSRYYPGGGLSNVESQWETMEEAEAAVAKMEPDCIDFVKIVDVSEMLGIGNKNDTHRN